jgi:hypothetical protein
MIAEFDQEKLRKFAVSFSPFETKIRRMSDVPLFKEGIGDSLAKQAAVDALINRARTDPKDHIWFGSHSVLVTIVEMYGYSDYQQWIKASKLFEDGDE